MSAILQSRDREMHQRTVPAASAPPLCSRAPSSVFALGDAATATPGQVSADEQGTQRERAAPRTEKALTLLRERGPMIPGEVADALNCDVQIARSMLCALKSRGVGVLGKRGRSSVYGLADAANQAGEAAAPVATPAAPAGSTPAMGGFRQWLENRGDPEASPRPASGRRRRVSEPRQRHPSPAQEGTPQDPKPEAEQPGLLCGLFNNGDLVLELGEQRMRLNKAQTQQLVRYLDLVGGASLPLEESR